MLTHGTLAVEDIDCIVGKNESRGVGLAESSGGYYYLCHNMSLGFELLELGRSADKLLLADKTAHSAGIAVNAATAVEMASESTLVLGGCTGPVAKNSNFGYIERHRSLAMAPEGVGNVVASGILL